MTLNKIFFRFSICALMAAVCGATDASAAVVQRGTATRGTNRASVASRVAPATNRTTSATTTATTTTADATVTPEPITVPDPTPATPTVVIADKTAQFDAALNTSVSGANNTANTELAEKIRQQRAALDAADATSTATATTTKMVTTGRNACDSGLRACIQEKCGNDFSKCRGDSDTAWGDKLDTCRRNVTCTSDEFNAFTPEIKADRDMNARLASYNKILDCGNRYNQCIATECGATYTKCLGKTAGDAAISACKKIADECKSDDSGLANRAMNVFATLRQDAEVQVQSDEKRLVALREQMANVCKRLGATFDERSLDCVYTVNFWANNSSTPYASKKAYAGATFDCTQNWFGVDVTTFRENAYRLTREQTSATSAILGAGVGVATGAITSGAISRAIDTKKAKDALNDAEEENAAINDDTESSSSVQSESTTSPDTKSENTTETTDATSDAKPETKTDTTNTGTANTTPAKNTKSDSAPTPQEVKPIENKKEE